MSENPFLLPHEVMDGVGVPDAFRDATAHRVVVAKYCALIEAVMQITGGEPVLVNLNRVLEINAMGLTTDPRDVVMASERPTEEKGIVAVSLATVDEVRAANRRYALWRMGATRN